MQTKSYKILILTFLISFAAGQFKKEISELNLPATMHSPKENYHSLLSPDRFNIHHGFSLNMVSFGNQSFSVGSYSNQMNYLLTDNLRLHLNFTLLQSGMTQQQSVLDNNLYYGASIDYKFTENSLFQISFQTSPTYRRHQPLTLNPIYNR